MINIGGDIVQNLDELNENNNNQYSGLNNPPTNFQGKENKSKGKNKDKYEKFYDEV